MDKIIWIGRAKNEVLQKSEEEMSSLNTIKGRKANLIGHI
jgi:hypothetical protein